jgi:hypothetical protein
MALLECGDDAGSAGCNLQLWLRPDVKSPLTMKRFFL